jgi:hypothetical protein
MSELTIQQGFQTAIRAMSEFANADVVINDWRILDASVMNGPWVIIENSDAFDSRQDTVEPETTWNIPINLMEPFTEWQTTLNNLRARRQAIIDKINSGNSRSAGGLEGTTVDRIRNDGDIMPVYDPYVSEATRHEAMPIFLTQRIVLEATEF